MRREGLDVILKKWSRGGMSSARRYFAFSMHAFSCSGCDLQLDALGTKAVTQVRARGVAGLRQTTGAAGCRYGLCADPSLDCWYIDAGKTEEVGRQGADIQPSTPRSHPHEEHSRAVQQSVLRPRLIPGRDCAVADLPSPFYATAFNADEPHLIQRFST